MTAKLLRLGSAMAVILMWMGCQEEYEFGTLSEPSNLVIDYEIVGADTNNPYGDGSGVVHFTVTANNALAYKFDFDGDEVVGSTGVRSKTFSKTGLHTYNINVVAIGVGGTSTSANIEIQVNSIYEPPADLIELLIGDGGPAPRSFRVYAELPGIQNVQGHFGLGPLGGVSPFEWWSAPRNDKSYTGMYDDRYIFKSDNTFTHATAGTIYGHNGLLDQDFGENPNAEVGYGDEYKHYPLENYEESWEISAPEDVLTLSITGQGFIGFYVGTNEYRVISYDENTITLATESALGDFSWWFTLTAE